MSITKATLRNRVLTHLTVIGAGETASAEDAAVVDDVIEAENEFLVVQGISSWATSAIPDEVAEPLKRYISARVANSFGKGDQSAVAEYELGVLRAVTMVKDDSAYPVDGTYY